MVCSICRNRFNGSSIRFQLLFLLGLALKNVDAATDVSDWTPKVEFSSASSLCCLSLVRQAVSIVFQFPLPPFNLPSCCVSPTIIGSPLDWCGSRGRSIWTSAADGAVGCSLQLEMQVFTKKDLGEAWNTNLGMQPMKTNESFNNASV